MAGRHRKPTPSRTARLARAGGIGSAAIAIAVLGAGGARAHNHLLNPSAACNQSGDDGTRSPGNSGDTGANPGNGRQVAKSKADTLANTGPAQGNDRCKGSR